MRAIGFASTILLIVCDALSFLTSSQAIFILSRIVAALGAGMLFAVGNAAAAAQPNAQRIFSSMLFVTVLLASVVYLLGPGSVEGFGPRGPLLVLVGISVVSLAAIAFLPDNLGLAHEDKAGRIPLSASAVLVLLAIFTLYSSQSGLWAYVERIGQAIGIGMSDIAIVLTINGFVSLIAALLANAIGLRLGFALPILAGMALQIGSALILPNTNVTASYGASAIAFTFGLIFVIPFLKAITAELDPSGRLASAATAAITLGSAAGPAAIGFALNNGATFQLAAVLSATGMTLASGAALVSLVLMAKSQRRAATRAQL